MPSWQTLQTRRAAVEVGVARESARTYLNNDALNRVRRRPPIVCEQLHAHRASNRNVASEKLEPRPEHPEKGRSKGIVRWEDHLHMNRLFSPILCGPLHQVLPKKGRLINLIEIDVPQVQVVASRLGTEAILPCTAQMGVSLTRFIAINPQLRFKICLNESVTIPPRAYAGPRGRGDGGCLTKFGEGTVRRRHLP